MTEKRIRRSDAELAEEFAQKAARFARRAKIAGDPILSEIDSILRQAERLLKNMHEEHVGYPMVTDAVHNLSNALDEGLKAQE